MTLLYLAIAYMLGVALGRYAWDQQWIDCTFPSLLWVLPLVALPFSPLVNRLEGVSKLKVPLRWPEWAGFERPRSGPSPALLFALCLCLLMGLARYASHPSTPCWQPDDLAFYNLPASQAQDRNAPEVTIRGIVNSYPLVADVEQQMRIAAHSVTVDGTLHDVRGELILKTGIRQRYRYGQPVQLQGRLVTPPDFEDFSYREYLARKGIHSQFFPKQIQKISEDQAGNPLMRWLFNIRSRGERLVNQLLPEPYAALANGMLLGIEAGIPDNLYEKFNLTGTSHVIVISGSNVALIAGVLMLIGQRLLSPRRAIWPTLVGIVCYGFLVGGDGAVMRAVFMGGLFVVATGLERSTTAMVSLLAACWAMTLINPLTLWDVGFQLSSSATGGLILFNPGVAALFEKLWLRIGIGKLSGFLSHHTSEQAVSSIGGAVKAVVEDGLIVTLAANLSTLPLVVYYFGRLSVASLLTNLLISPVQSFIMLWGSAALVVGILGLPWIAWVLFLVPLFSLRWTVAMVSWTAALPGASLEIVGYGFGALLFTYLILGVIRFREPLTEWATALRRRLHSPDRGAWLQCLMGRTALVVISISNLLMWSAVSSLPDGRLHVYFLDIGQGDGIFIETPSGLQVLIDGGSSPQQLFAELGDVMPFWDREIDLLLLTHPDGDHMNAQVEVPARFAIGHAIEQADSHANPDAQRWRDAMTAAGATIDLQSAGGWLDLGDGVALWTLWPPAQGYVGENQDNENSIVSKLVYGDFSVLLTGDAGFPSEAELLDEGAPIQATVLKVGHHGSKGSSSPEFVEAVQPSIAVIQIGENNYGHPSPEAMESLGNRLILRNDRHGRIHMASDGAQIWFDTERE